MAIIEQVSPRISIHGVEGQNIGVATDKGARRRKAFVQNVLIIVPAR